MDDDERRTLTMEERMAIMELQGKRSPYKVARDYDVSHTAIYNIWKSKKYQQLFECQIQSQILKKMAKVIMKDSEFLDKLKIVKWTDIEKDHLKKLKIEFIF